MRKWNLIKHLFTSFIIAIGLDFLIGPVVLRKLENLGMINRIDGPTAIFASKLDIQSFLTIVKATFRNNLVGIVLFLIGMIFYLPINKLSNKRI